MAPGARFLRAARPIPSSSCTMMINRIALPIAAALLFAPSGPALAQTRDSTLTGFPALAREFVYTSLAFSPASATQAGLHDWTDPYTGRRAHLDSLLDSFSPEAIAKQRAYFCACSRSSAAMDRAHLDAADAGRLRCGRQRRCLRAVRADEGALPPVQAADVRRRSGQRALREHFARVRQTRTHAPPISPRASRAFRAFLRSRAAISRATNDIYTKVALEETDGVTRAREGHGRGLHARHAISCAIREGRAAGNRGARPSFSAS